MMKDLSPQSVISVTPLMRKKYKIAFLGLQRNISYGISAVLPGFISYRHRNRMTRNGLNHISLLHFLPLMRTGREMMNAIRPVRRLVLFYNNPVADDDQLPEFVVLRAMDRDANLRNRVVSYLKDETGIGFV